MNPCVLIPQNRLLFMIKFIIVIGYMLCLKMIYLSSACGFLGLCFYLRLVLKWGSILSVRLVISNIRKGARVSTF